MSNKSESPEEAYTPSVQFAFMKLIVRDLGTMTAFYQQALGLTVARTIDAPTLCEVVMRRAGDETGFCLVLFHHKDGREVSIGNGYGPIGIYTRDVGAAFRNAVSAGAVPQQQPFDVGKLRVAFVTDPEGHEIEFLSTTRLVR